jgi:hypothetical protein
MPQETTEGPAAWIHRPIPHLSVCSWKELVLFLLGPPGPGQHLATGKLQLLFTLGCSTAMFKDLELGSKLHSGEAPQIHTAAQHIFFPV